MSGSGPGTAATQPQDSTDVAESYFSSCELLRRVALFEGRDPHFIIEIGYRTTLKSFQPGQVIVHTGSKSSCLWIVQQGSVEVHCQGSCLRQLGEGDSFGEAQLLGRERTRESLRARSPVCVWRLSRSALLKVLASYPKEQAHFRQLPWNGSGQHRKRSLNQLSSSTMSTETKTPYGWQSLASWHRQLAASPEGRRLNLWQLDFYRDSSCFYSPSEHSDKVPHVVSVEDSSLLEASLSRSAERSERSLQRRLHPGKGTSRMPSVPFPRLPRSALYDPACVDRCHSRGCSRELRQNRPYSNCGLPAEQRSPSAPPGLQEAIAGLSKGLLRSQWHCKNIARVADENEMQEMNAKVTNEEIVTTAADWQCGVSQATVRQSFDPPRKLEVTLRGTFCIPRTAAGEAEELNRNSISVTHNAQAMHGSPEALVDESLRERMGFAVDECGMVPSGRGSVPSIHPGSSTLDVGPADEGIELQGLVDKMDHLVRLALDRTPSRTSCQVPAQSPRPVSTNWRLCRSRCGTSSAVLELMLEHGPDCSEVLGCLCSPAPTEAEARLVAHFSRHAPLRLSASAGLP